MTTTVTDEVRLAWGAAVRDKLEALRPLHSIVGERITRQANVDETLRAAGVRAGSEAMAKSAALKTLADASEDAVKRAKLVALKLETAHLEGQLTTETYQALVAAAFAQAPGLIGATPGDRFQALNRIVAALATVPDADKGGVLAKSAEAGAKALEAANDAAKKEAVDETDALDKLSQARTAWDDAYGATKDIVAGLLREAGRRGEHTAIFPDLAAPKR